MAQMKNSDVYTNFLFFSTFQKLPISDVEVNTFLMQFFSSALILNSESRDVK